MDLLMILAVAGVEARGGMPYQARPVYDNLKMATSYLVGVPTDTIDPTMLASHLDTALNNAGLPRKI